MAKTPKVKKREISVHSRAARRGAPPVKEVASNGAVEETDYKPWLHNAQNAGISKKRKAKQLTRQQKARHQRGLEKADANAEKLERKVEDSKDRGKKVNARRVDWEELNDKISSSVVIGKEAEKATRHKSESHGAEAAAGTSQMEDVDVQDAVVSTDATQAVGVDVGANTEAKGLSTAEAIQRFNGIGVVEEEVDEIT